MSFDPVTIIIIIVALIALWFLFRIVLRLTAAVFQIGCVVIFVVAVGALALYFFDII